MSKVKDNSLGVGLSCSKQIVEAMKGSIKVLNTKAGTSIQIKIPVGVSPAITSKSELNYGSE
jgi:C4-dicarboxylate-specific signal transduction histidine kinase